MEMDRKCLQACHALMGLIIWRIFLYYVWNQQILVLDSEFQTVVSLWIIRVSYSFLESSQSQHKVWFPELFWGVRDATKGRCYKLLVLMDRIFQFFQNAGISKTELGRVKSTEAEKCGGSQKSLCWLFWNSLLYVLSMRPESFTLTEVWWILTL